MWMLLTFWFESSKYSHPMKRLCEIISVLQNTASVLFLRKAQTYLPWKICKNSFAFRDDLAHNRKEMCMSHDPASVSLRIYWEKLHRFIKHTNTHDWLLPCTGPMISNKWTNTLWNILVLLFPNTTVINNNNKIIFLQWHVHPYQISKGTVMLPSDAIMLLN